jgi:ring-1,2-phenylacetyl-CoA epoxidase subunit PaaD
VVNAEAVRAAVAAVVDPEIPVLTIEDLGVLRDVSVDEDGRVEVTITPTYSGCPAMDTIQTDVERTLQEHGFGDAVVRTVLSPAWTTEWMTEEGKRKLADYGVAPPAPATVVCCPQCGSTDTRLVSRFGSTACKALRACNSCLEPFDHFRCH